MTKTQVAEAERLLGLLAQKKLSENDAAFVTAYAAALSRWKTKLSFSAKKARRLTDLIEQM